jgi:hypothetical protein
MPHDDWEFTPHNGITHICECGVCTRFKEHCLVVEAPRDDEESSAWKTRDKYEQDLIHLGWTLAHEGGQVPPNKANLMMLSALNEALECQNCQMAFQLEAVHQVNNQLNEELKCEHFDSSLQADKADFWLDEVKDLQERYRILEDQLFNSQQHVPSLNDEDIVMRPRTSADETSD